MALFNSGTKETKEEKQARKTAEMLRRFGLESMNDPRDLATVRKIAEEMTGNGLIEFGTILSGKAEDVAKISYLRALLEQNWIIIRQLDKLNSYFDALGRK